MLHYARSNDLDYFLSFCYCYSAQKYLRVSRNQIRKKKKKKKIVDTGRTRHVFRRRYFQRSNGEKREEKPGKTGNTCAASQIDAANLFEDCLFAKIYRVHVLRGVPRRFIYQYDFIPRGVIVFNKPSTGYKLDEVQYNDTWLIYLANQLANFIERGKAPDCFPSLLMTTDFTRA